MIKNLTINARKPKGIFGFLMILKMNRGHKALTEWAINNIGFENSNFILDIGCGGGKAIKKILSTTKTSKVYGIDYSGLAVKRARKENKKYILEGRCLINKSSVSNLSFDRDTFDTIISVESIYFWDNLTDQFKSIKNILKPEGRFAIVCEMVREKGQNVREDIVEFLQMYVPSIDNLKSMLLSSGYSKINYFYDENHNWLCMIAVK